MASFKTFSDGMQKAVDGFPALADRITNQLANEFLRRVVDRTPINKIISAPTRGQLKRNWKKSRLKRDVITRTVKVYNRTTYASFVELGHRKRGGKGWVEGQFFMENTKNHLNHDLERLVTPTITNYINRRINGGSSNG